MAEPMFDNEHKEDDRAAASAALSNLFNSEQAYGIELSSFPTEGGGEEVAAAVTAASGTSTPAIGKPETLASVSPAVDVSMDGALDPALADPMDEMQQPLEPLPLVEPAPRPKRPGTSRQHMLTRGGACEFCKRRKLKCTAEMPQCAACRRSNRECVYSQKKQRSRMKLLEDKVNELENRLATAPAPRQEVHEGLFTAQGPQPVSGEAPSAGVELAFLGLGEHSSLTLADMSLTPGGKHNEEPDLMTLADAATADTDGRMPWDGMEPQAIADEIVKAIIGHDRGGVGEKICAHLIQVFVSQTDSKLVHWLISPSYLWARLTGRGGSQPHPAFLLALMPTLMPFSPNATLSHYKTISAVTDTVCVPSRALQQQALSTLDPRVLDLVCAATLRSLALACAGRFVDGWNENSTACSLLWATGLGKLGGVGEMFVAPEKRPADRAMRLEREHGSRLVRAKGQIVPPPSDAQDVGERIRLFWSVWINDCVNGIGWNWPCDIALEETTTPLPRDSYDTDEDLTDNTTLHDFLSERVHSSLSDGRFASRVKSLALAYAAGRQLDRAPSVATPDVTARLLRISRRHMATMRAFAPATPDEAKQHGGDNEDWMTMYAALMLLYAKEELDAPSSAEASEARDKMIEAGVNATRCIQAALDAGDAALEGYDVVGPSIWFVVGRALHHVANRIEAAEPLRAAALRESVRANVTATGICCKTLRLNDVYYQMMFNVSMDQEVMLGEYRRPDNTDFDPPVGHGRAGF
ncbi:hypothetical protein CspeluHIS016_0401060 [Cutaneotrichosporon spelunceum]|uniref:Zn(2)-C6 fungal-type domain-containing protein n=1 Tax=Cutaneotrichosporon spelunceum TaxID=1672016 RepID=A0AAD3TUR0_9TREE|nr:hypothetical protein CspeluHIS016_0401060 [Cutaneotrichosporon spelunceum]